MIEEKKCKGKCGKVKPLHEYHCDKNGRDGRKSKCKVCISEYRSEWDKQNNSAINARRREAYRKNPEKKIAEVLRYKKENPDKDQAWGARRRAAKLQRTAAWADLDKIKDIYNQCAEINLAAKTAGCTETFVVDHVIPLISKLVSGLHVEANLDIITLGDNCRKSNKFIPG